MKLNAVFRQRWWLLYIPILATACLLFWLCATLWTPLPPKRLSLAVNEEDVEIALKYRQRLEQRGIQMRLVKTSGDSGALQAVAAKNADPAADAGFALGLLNTPGDAPVYSLGAVERQPVWIFSRLSGLNNLGQMHSGTIGVPSGDSPAHRAMGILLKHYQTALQGVQIRREDPSKLARLLLDGQLDVVVLVNKPTQDTVRLLMQNSAVHMVGLDRVGSIQARDARLRPFVLPQGAIEYRGDIPSRDLTLVASHLNLVIRPDMHPALQRALLDVAMEVHEAPGVLRRQGEFPALRGTDFTPSPQLRAYMLGQRPWMELILTYWWAQLAQLLLYAALPILLVTLLLLAWVPGLFEWRINAVLQNYYGELKFLEKDIETAMVTRPIVVRQLMKEIDGLEQKVADLDLPNEYGGRWYTLRSHLAQARARLLELRAR